MHSTLRLKVTGERLRSLISLRLKEFDRNIERVNAALQLSEAELAQGDVEVRARVEAQIARAHSPGLNLRDTSYETVGLGNVMSARAMVEKHKNTVAVLTNYRQQAQWVSDSFVPSDVYEVSGDDLIILGIGNSPLTTRGIFDPLDL